MTPEANLVCPSHSRPTPHIEATGAKIPNKLWALLYSTESSGMPWRGREGRRAPENPLRIINISSLSTFLRITFVLLCPVPADRAAVSPPSPLLSLHSAGSSLYQKRSWQSASLQLFRSRGKINFCLSLIERIVWRAREGEGGAEEGRRRRGAIVLLTVSLS